MNIVEGDITAFEIAVGIFSGEGSRAAAKKGIENEVVRVGVFGD